MTQNLSSSEDPLHGFIFFTETKVLPHLIFCFRIAGNASYVIGSLAETTLGCSRIVRLCAASSEEESSEILKSLTSLLDVTDTDLETVLNAAGTLGTLVSCLSCFLVNLTVNKEPGTSYRMEYHFPALITYIFCLPL